MYKKLILTFTLAAGLSVLPNAFAAPSNPTPGEPAPKPNTTNTTKHGEDSIDVLVAIKARPQPAPPSKPNTTKTINHGEDSVTVLAWKKGPPKGRYGEDSATVLARKNEPRPPPRRPIHQPLRNHGEDSTIV